MTDLKNAKGVLGKGTADEVEVGYFFGEIDHLEDTVKVLSKKSFHEDRKLWDSIEALWEAIDQIRLAVPSLAKRLDIFGRIDGK